MQSGNNKKGRIVIFLPGSILLVIILMNSKLEMY